MGNSLPFLKGNRGRGVDKEKRREEVRERNWEKRMEGKC